MKRESASNFVQVELTRKDGTVEIVEVNADNSDFEIAKYYLTNEFDVGIYPKEKMIKYATCKVLRTKEKVTDVKQIYIDNVLVAHTRRIEL